MRIPISSIGLLSNKDSGLGSYSVYIKIKYNSCYYGFLINNDYGADIINFKSIISFLKVTQYEYCVC